MSMTPVWPCHRRIISSPRASEQCVGDLFIVGDGDVPSKPRLFSETENEVSLAEGRPEARFQSEMESWVTAAPIVTRAGSGADEPVPRLCRPAGGKHAGQCRRIKAEMLRQHALGDRAQIGGGGKVAILQQAASP